MGLISELRYPTRWYGKLITATLALTLFGLFALATVSAFVLHHILTPPETRPLSMTKNFPGHPEEFSFTAGADRREGWFFPWLKTAPTLVLCHGYGSRRDELLTLATALQENQFNVYLFDFAGHGGNAGFTSFGYREAEELKAAMSAVTQRDDVDRTRFGLWGTNLGGYAALAAAASDPRVKAYVADSVYDEPAQLARIEIARSGLGRLPMVRKATLLGFRWLNYPYRFEKPLSARLARTTAAKLYISASDEPQLAELTRDLFIRSPEPREQVILAHGNYASMADEEKRAYESRIVSFFLLRLPPSGGQRR